MICQVCGKEFHEGEDPKTGIPNGVGLCFDPSGEEVFTVCSDCVMHRYEDVIEQAMQFKQGVIPSDAIDF